MEHITVLKQEAVDSLNLSKKSIVVDATLGSLGHAKEILSRLGKKGLFIGFDVDPKVIKRAKAEFGTSVPCQFFAENFRDIGSVLKHHGIGPVNAILADLGWRMEQFEGSGKGFSFRIDEPLLMTFGNPKRYPFTARDIVNEWEEESIANILFGYGEERYARRIAAGIVSARKKTPILTSGALAEIIEASVPVSYTRLKIHPATKSFQALRITVNDELQALESFITEAFEMLEKRGRLAIITFHSLEDRIVKHMFRSYAHDQKAVVHTKKPIIPTREEITANKRARSAKLRVLEKI